MIELHKPNAREFVVWTSFQRAACRPGGLPRDQALRRAESNLEQIKPIFAAWLDKELHELARIIPDATVNLEDPSWIESVAASSERLIDVAVTMGYPFVSFVAVNLRKICEAARNGAECSGDILVCHVDALFLGRRPQYMKMTAGELPELSEGLRSIVESSRLQPKFED